MLSCSSVAQRVARPLSTLLTSIFNDARGPGRRAVFFNRKDKRWSELIGIDDLERNYIALAAGCVRTTRETSAETRDNEQDERRTTKLLCAFRC